MDAYSTYTDQQLLTLLRDSDERAFTEIYNRYWNKLFAVAYHRLEDEMEAEEIVQDIYVSLWKRRKDIQLYHPLKSYLSIAVKYQVITHLARLKRRKDYEGYLAKSFLNRAETTSEWLSEKELRAQIATCISRLPEKCRIVFLMSREQGMSNDLIAKNLQISPKTVEGHITKALHLLRAALKLLHILLFFLF